MGQLQHTPPTPVARREFLASSLLFASSAALIKAQGEIIPEFLGPILGHVDESSAYFWIKAPHPGKYKLQVHGEGAIHGISTEGEATEKNQGCVHFKLESLRPNTKYTYQVFGNDRPVFSREHFVFKTPPLPDQPSIIKLAISSCAQEDRGSREVWKQMAARNPQGVVLLGDTPYIDSTKPEVQNKRHHEFAAVKEYQNLLMSRPCWWTWDDHDFAGNNSSGLAEGKEHTLSTFKHYRPQKTYGNGKEGIYTSFRLGGIEIFLLDTRYFSMTGPSFASPHLPTLLGQDQWEWLQKGLKASTATFKILASGIIWDDKENSESDDWGTYLHELNAIRQFIGKEKISGVILMGGDIHASRVLRYKTEKSVGYDLVQFIASPIHGSTIPSLNVYHPNLVRSAVEPNVFLEVEVDTTEEDPVFSAALVNRKGETVFSYRLLASELKA